MAERKDVLCAFFWMLTLLLYTQYAGKPSVVRYLFTLGSFVLCLMAKPMAVTLPFVLLLLDYWPLKRISALKTLLLEKVPFLVFTVIGCLLTVQAQEIAIVSTAGLPVSQRIVHVLAAYNHYLGAMLLPRDLAVYYPYQFQIPAATIIWAVIVLGLITVLAIKNFRQRPYLIVGWFWYLGTLVPVIGLVQVGDQAWADRYTYLPLIGLFMLLVWLACETIKSRIVLQTVAVVLALALMAATSMQLRYWKNTTTLFEHTAKVTQQNALAVTILGSVLAKEGKLTEAMEHYRTALRYQPRFPEAHFFLGNALDEQGKLDEAIAEYEQALWFRPTEEQTHVFLGIALGKQKKYDEAVAHYNAALKLNPDSAVAENNLARILHTQGRWDEAIEHYNAALAINPKLALAHNNLGILQIQKGSLADGTKHLREALRLKPGNAETKFNLALALNQQGQWSEAASFFKETMGDHPNDSNAHYQFAVALGHLQKTREAMGEFAAALLIQPDFPDALNNLAWILSTDVNPNFRNGIEAVKMAGHACELTSQQDASKLKTLAAAYAETGRFDEAIKTLQTAITLAAKSNRQELMNECTNMLADFQKSKPWRSP
ncbi:MAG: tetratricopeptide repeat protein [Limisphaerales bacterium]